MDIVKFCIVYGRRFTTFIRKCSFSLEVRYCPTLRKRRFLHEWTNVLFENATVFNGLFASLQQVVDGEAKKPEKTLKEWSLRTKYKWENQRVDQLCRKLIMPAVETVQTEKIHMYAALLLQAATQAGITKETEKTFRLDEKRANAYIEWNGEEVYLDDEIEVIHPAWYQNGRLVEQGHCILKNTTANE